MGTAPRQSATSPPTRQEDLAASRAVARVGYGSLAKDGLRIALGHAAAAFGTVVGLRALTELAPPELFGRFVLVNGILALGQGILFQPHAQAALRYYPQFEFMGCTDAVRRKLWRACWTRWAVGATTVTVAALVDLVSLRLLAPAVWALVTVGLLAEGWKTVEVVIRNASGRQGAYAALFAADAVVRPAGSALAAWTMGTSLESLLGGQVAASLLVLWAFSLRGRYARTPSAASSAPRHTPELINLYRSMDRFARPLFGLPILAWVTALGDRYIVGGMLGLADAGVYAAAYGLANRPVGMVASVTDATLRQSLYTWVAQGDRRKARKLLLAWLGANLALGGALAAGIVGFRRALVGVLLARDYRPTAGALLPWICLGHVIWLAAQAVERLAYARGRTRGVLLEQAVVAAVSVLTAAAGASWAGLEGVAMAVPVYFSLQLLLAGWVALTPGPLRSSTGQRL